MAQGGLKKPQKSALVSSLKSGKQQQKVTKHKISRSLLTASTASSMQLPRRGGGVRIAPKNSAEQDAAKIRKKLTATINNNIERVMATRAGAVGKLTIMKPLVDRKALSELKGKSKK